MTAPGMIPAVHLLAKGVFFNMANEIMDPAAAVAELVRSVLSPPSSGMGGGSLSEERSQDAWRGRCVADLRRLRSVFGPRGLAPELHEVLDVCAKILRVNTEIRCDACGCRLDGEPRADEEVPGARLCRRARCMDGLKDKSPDERRALYDAPRSKKNT